MTTPASNPPAFRAILCDVDGVIRDWGDSMARVDRAYAQPPGTLAAAAFAPERLLPAITGGVTDEAWRAGVTADLSERLGGDTAAAMVAMWSAFTGTVDAEVLAFLTEARTRVPVAFVSNATSRLEADLAGLGLLDAVDAVVNTSRIGFAKPDHRVYVHAAEVLGVPVQDCLFIDDSPGNVTAAQALGMQGLHFRNAADLRAYR